MAIRYCGTLKLVVRYIDASASYNVRISERDGDIAPRTLRDLRLSPHAQSQHAVDCSRAYDLVAESALGFATYDDDSLYPYTEEREDSFVVRRFAERDACEIVRS